jgi:hypothetical protein
LWNVRAEIGLLNLKVSPQSIENFRSDVAHLIGECPGWIERKTTNFKPWYCKATILKVSQEQQDSRGFRIPLSEVHALPAEEPVASVADD